MKELSIENKELLLKDLSSRLFYNPWVQFNLEYGDNGHKEGLYKAHISSIDPTCGWLEVDYFETETLEKEWSGTIENVKPYLRPMSSMTEEERNEYFDFRSQELQRVAFAEVGREEAISEVMDWLLSHHFDIRGLISLGLALEAPKEMY